jgi:hypothetical protein
MRLLELFAGAAALLAIILLYSGCERKVVYENGGDQTSLSSCFTCHGEDGLLLAAEGEWRNSIHASGNNVDYTNRLGSSCPQCHDHQGFVEYLATGSVSPPYDQVSSIHCFTCHSPHVRGNLSLRTDAPYTLENGEIFNHGPANLCVNCHHSRLSAATITDNQPVSEHWGPHHGPQGDLLNASNGYEFDGYDYGNTGHANIFNNVGCIGCHMGNPQTHIGYRIGGHSFNMVYYDIIEDTALTLVGVCQQCHPSTESFDHDGIQTEVDSLLEELETLLYAAGVIGADAHPFDDDTIPDVNVAGALYNFLVVEEDRSHGVHNPEYIVDLLESAIEYMESIMLLTPKSGKARVAISPLRAH